MDHLREDGRLEIPQILIFIFTTLKQMSVSLLSLLIL